MSDEISADERSAGNRYLEAHRPGWSYLPGLSKLWEEAFAIGYAACAIYRGKTPVVAEEPEWEYGIHLNQTSTADKVILWPEHEASNPFSGTRVRRVPAIPAGPWVEVTDA